jgi:hypothetical protein
VANAHTKRKKSRGKNFTSLVRERETLFMVVGVVAGALITQGYSLVIQAGFLSAHVSQESEPIQLLILNSLGALFFFSGLAIVLLVVWLVRKEH